MVISMQHEFRPFFVAFSVHLDDKIFDLTKWDIEPFRNELIQLYVMEVAMAKK